MIGFVLVVAALQVHLHRIASVLGVCDHLGEATIPQVGSTQTRFTGLGHDGDVEIEFDEGAAEFASSASTLVLEVDLRLAGE